jgi:hypothetical protein
MSKIYPELNMFSLIYTYIYIERERERERERGRKKERGSIRQPLFFFTWSFPFETPCE